MDGFEATRKLRADERFIKTPIVAMTANAMAGDREQCLEAGMDDHIAKPIDPDALLDMVAAWITVGPVKEGGGSDPATLPKADVKAFELPTELPGINVTAGVRSMGGNHKLYHKLALEFVNEYSDALSRVQADLADKVTDDTMRLVHTVKGILGTLGATGASKAGEALETALKSGKKARIQKSLDEFSEQLTTAMNSLASLRIEEMTDADEAETLQFGEATDPEALAVEFQELATLLVDGDVDASDKILMLAPTLQRSGFAPAAKQMQAQIDKFEFDEALAALLEIAQELDIEIGEQKS